MTTVLLIVAGLALMAGLAALLLIQARRRGRSEAALEISRNARKARDRMDRVEPAGERGILERLLKGRF
jgi:hypothetical protein